MIKKTIYSSTFLLILLFISCGKKANNTTNPTSSPNTDSTENTSAVASEYTVNGIDAKYESVWYFYNTDNTGNTAVNIDIKDGGITGLVVSNKTDKVNFSKNSIYSIADENKNKYYERYYGYIISDGIWVGEIHFPTYDDETVGYVYIKNKNNSDIIVGIINKSSYPNDGIDNEEYYGTRTSTDANGLKRTLDITKEFVTYSENNIVKLKVPSSYFEAMVGENFSGYSVAQGLLYDGVSINGKNNNNKYILPDLYFEYYDNNYKLDIVLREDNVPISAKYTKKEDIISPNNILYKK